MLRKVRIIIGVFFILVSPSLFALTSETVSGQFDGVLVKGDITVRLHHTRGQSYAVAKGDPRDLAYFEFKIDKGVLKICVGKGFPHFANMVVDVWVNDLHCLKQYGFSKVSGRNLYSSGLHLLAKGQEPVILSGHLKVDIIQAMLNSKVQIDGIQSKHLILDIRQHADVKLKGVVGISHLTMADDSHLNLYWMKTNQIKIILKDRAHVHIAGKVLILDLEMFDQSFFAGRHLRANRAFVKTHQRAIAEISVERSQHTFALDQSHIDFFNVPLMKTDFMVENAAVLDLREWSMPYGQEDEDFAD